MGGACKVIRSKAGDTSPQPQLQTRRKEGFGRRQLLGEDRAGFLNLLMEFSVSPKASGFPKEISKCQCPSRATVRLPLHLRRAVHTWFGHSSQPLPPGPCWRLRCPGAGAAATLCCDSPHSPVSETGVDSGEAARSSPVLAPGPDCRFKCGSALPSRLSLSRLINSIYLSFLICKWE